MIERRNAPRYQSEVPAWISHPAGGEPSRVTVQTLAVRGCAVEGPDIPNPGNTCHIMIEWQGREIHAEAQVAWKNSLKNLAGLKFTSVDEQSTVNLRALCATLRLEPLAPMSYED